MAAYEQIGESSETGYATPDQPGGIPGWQEGIPVIRITTCGVFTIEILQEVPESDPAQARYAKLSPERLRGRGPGPALALVKLLISQQGRYAPKDWLMTHLRQEDEVCVTEKRMENIVSYVRGLLCLPSGKKLQDLLTYVRTTKESGDGYRLAGFPLVWLDLDALAYHVKQACLLERFGDDPLFYWERAYQLASRGRYLSEEAYSTWGEAQREVVEDYLRQSVHALARLYLVRYGEAAEEEVIRLLRTYWRAHPTDEDALWPLMDLLGKRERYQEALEYYRQLEAALEASGLTKEGHSYEPDARTHELADYLRLKERKTTTSLYHHMKPLLSSSFGKISELKPVILPHTEEWLRSETFSPPSIFPDTISSSATTIHAVTSVPSLPYHLEKKQSPFSSSLFSLGVELLALIQPQEVGLFHEFMQRVEQALESRKEMLQGTYSRRQAMQLLASLTLGVLNEVQVTSGWMAEDVVTFCTASIAVCWHLFWEGSFAEVENLLPAYFSHLTPLAQSPSSFQRRASDLLAQAHQIASLLVLEREDFGMASHHCKQALSYGAIARDPNLQVAALVRQANIYFYRKRPSLILQTYQQALPLLDQVSPLLQGRIYSGLSSAQAELGQKEEALRSAGLAHEVFPVHPEDDPGFLYTNTTRYILHFNDATTYLHFQQPQNAWEALKLAAAFVPNEITPRGMELQNHRTIIAIALGNLDQSTTYFERLVLSGATLGSDLHQNEACGIYDQMKAQWPHERRVKQLEALLKH
jgi:tetratricopeptide (TPR) repeat protein